MLCSSGVKKKINKTSQRLSEKVSRKNKGSEVDEEIIELGRKLDVVNESVKNMQMKTREYLQPNPSARTKMAIQASYQVARGQLSTAKYPQPEHTLAQVFSNFGRELNNSSSYTLSLIEVGAAFHKLSQTKDSIETNVSKDFIGSLSAMQQKELKEISQNRKKLEGRRLDYDYKKNKGEKVPAEELEAAETKFNESKELCLNGMKNFIENDLDHIAQLLQFAQSIYDGHKQCTRILGSLSETLSTKLCEASSRPRRERQSVKTPVDTPVGQRANISDKPVNPEADVFVEVSLETAVEAVGKSVAEPKSGTVVKSSHKPKIAAVVKASETPKSAVKSEGDTKKDKDVGNKASVEPKTEIVIKSEIEPNVEAVLKSEVEPQTKTVLKDVVEHDGKVTPVDETPLKTQAEVLESGIKVFVENTIEAAVEEYLETSAGSQSKSVIENHVKPEIKLDEKNIVDKDNEAVIDEKTDIEPPAEDEGILGMYLKKRQEREATEKGNVKITIKSHNK